VSIETVLLIVIVTFAFGFVLDRWNMRLSPTGGKIVPCSLKKWSQHARSRNPDRLLARADELIE